MKKKERFLLAADIGATTSRLGIFSLKPSQPRLRFSLEFPSREFSSLHAPLRDAIEAAWEQQRIRLTEARVAVPGPVVSQACSPSNLPWKIGAKELARKTGLRNVFLLNDFEALGNALPTLKGVRLLRGRPSRGAVKAAIGAGTGLGKAILAPGKGRYTVLPSEGSHKEFPFLSEEELRLAKTLAGNSSGKGRQRRPSFDDIVSGRGIVSLYRAIRKRDKRGQDPVSRKIARAPDTAAAVAGYAKTDPACKEAFRLFSRFYARAVRDFALETLPFGGLYIAGGIARKNPWILGTREFRAEFLRSGDARSASLLRRIPLYLVEDPYAGLKGAALSSGTLR